MKLTYKFIILPLITLFILSGCEKINNEVQNSESQSSISYEHSSEEETSSESTTLPEIDVDANTNGKFVLDDARILSDKDYKTINSYASYYNQIYKINFSAVVIADLGGRTAKEYAEKCYKKLYGDADGVLFLINNDTGNDRLLRKGAPEHFISDSDVDMLFTEISPMLVTENYTDAVKAVGNLFERNLPKFSIDRTGKMKKEEITEVNNILTNVANASNGTETLSVIFVNSTEGKTMENYAKAQEEKLFSPYDSGGRAVMIVNTENAEYGICTYGGLIANNQDAIKEQIAGCLTEIDGKKSFNYKSAAEIFVKFMGK